MKINCIYKSICCQHSSSNYLSKRFFYHVSTKNDTIYAPCTPLNVSIKGSPLGVIRLSGPKTSQILSKLTNLQVVEAGKNQDRRSIMPRVATLTKYYSHTNRELIDIGIAIWFPKPNSYTGEDVCEFHLHGSHAIMSSIMATLATFEQVRPAEPGEFTRRAWLNKKMSLVEAESLPELIASRSDNQRRLALKGLDGTTMAKYSAWTDQLINILAHIEASIDFGEDELLGEQKVVAECISKIGTLADELDRFIDSSTKIRQIVHSGWKVAILGKPNAGKSSLMNVLCKRDKSIVSDLKGTTRDVIEHYFELGGHAISLCDTAGLRETLEKKEEFIIQESSDTIVHHDSIERQGIGKAIIEANLSDVLIYMVDGTELSQIYGQQSMVDYLVRELRELSQVLNRHLEKTRLINLVVNKIDELDDKQVEQLLNIKRNPTIWAKLEQSMKALVLGCHEVVLDMSVISCKTQKNLDIHSEQLIHHFNSGLKNLSKTSKNSSEDGGKHPSQDNNTSISSTHYDYVNERHVGLLKSTSRHLNKARTMNLNNIDEMAQHLREAVSYLSRVVGSIDQEEVIDVIFRDFCIGK